MTRYDLIETGITAGQNSIILEKILDIFMELEKHYQIFLKQLDYIYFLN